MVRSLLNWLHLFLIKLPTVLQNREQQEELVRVTARLAVLSKDAVVVHEGYPQDNYADLSQKQLLEELVKVIFHVSVRDWDAHRKIEGDDRGEGHVASR